MTRASTAVVVLAVSVAALASAGCGPGPSSSSRSAARPAQPASTCRREELARTTLTFASESGALASSCPAPARTQLSSLAAHYRTTLEALRRITLDDKCGPGGSAQLAPYEEILLAMHSVLTACDASPDAPSLDAALSQLRDAMALAAEAPDASPPPTSR